MFKKFTFVISVALLTASKASAVGFLTQMNCASDYYAYCSQFQVGSKELRVCMSRAGPKLSKSCLNALIADGEVSQAEINSRKQQLEATKSAKQKPASEQKPAEIASARETRNRETQERIARDQATQDRATLALRQSTYEALKSREPRFIEVAAVVETEGSGDEPEVRDPTKQISTAVADPSPGQAKNADRRREQSSIGRAKSAKMPEGVRPAKSKTKIAAHKIKAQRSADGRRMSARSAW